MDGELNSQFVEQLAKVFGECMRGVGGSALLQTAALGQNAQAAQRDALELLAAQQEALITVLLERVSFEERARLLETAAAFAENLAPAVQTPRSVRDSVAFPRLMSAELRRQAVKHTADLRRMNESLRKSEERFRTLSEAAPIGIFEADAAGCCLYTNERWQRIYGMTLAESLGEGWARGVHPEDRAAVLEEWAAYVRTGEEFTREFRVMTPQGEVRWVSTRARPLRADNGAIRGHIRTAEDITERKQTEAWLEGLLDSTQDAVVAIDQRGHIMRFNPAAEKIFGYAQSEVVGQKVQLLMPEPYAGEHDGYIARYERTGERRAIDRIRAVAARRKSGEVFPIELSVIEVKVGNTVYYSAFIRDISEKVKLQERLLEKERLAAIGATAAKLAHEIGNPLNGMFLATQLLELQLEKLQGDETVRSSVRALRNQISHLSQLLYEFRSLARRQRYTFRQTNMRELVREVLTAELPCYTEQSIAVEQVFAPALPLVRVDQDKFKQVVLNLCKNAVEAMTDGGTLTVHVHNSDQHLHVEVSDTGAGIPLDVNIFELFVTTKAQGTGLGLPIARQIVDAHGGTLAYTSEPGRGTTFVVTLPLQLPTDFCEEA